MHRDMGAGEEPFQIVEDPECEDEEQWDKERITTD